MKLKNMLISAIMTIGMTCSAFGSGLYFISNDLTSTKVRYVDGTREKFNIVGTLSSEYLHDVTNITIISIGSNVN